MRSHKSTLFCINIVNWNLILERFSWDVFVAFKKKCIFGPITGNRWWWIWRAEAFFLEIWNDWKELEFLKSIDGIWVVDNIVVFFLCSLFHLFIFVVFLFFCLLEPDIGLGVEVDDKVFAISHSQPSLCESNFNYCW